MTPPAEIQPASAETWAAALRLFQSMSVVRYGPGRGIWDGTRYLVNHGDQAKGGSGIAGALSPLMLMDARKRKRAMATKQEYDYQVLGHWHQLIQFKGMIINGSLKGYDEWTASMNFEWELPAQAAWITHPDHGITVRWPIYLEKQGATFP